MIDEEKHQITQNSIVLLRFIDPLNHKLVFPNTNDHALEEENSKSAECDFANWQATRETQTHSKLNSSVERENIIREGALVYNFGEDRFFVDSVWASWQNLGIVISYGFYYFLKQ